MSDGARSQGVPLERTLGASLAVLAGAGMAFVATGHWEWDRPALGVLIWGASLLPWLAPLVCREVSEVAGATARWWAQLGDDDALLWLVGGLWALWYAGMFLGVALEGLPAS